MAENKKFLTGMKLQAILDKWKSLVESGVYKEKIPYKTWRELTAMAKNYPSTIGYSIQPDNTLFIGHVEVNASSMFANFFLSEMSGEATTLNCTKYSDLAATATTAWDNLTATVGTTYTDGVTYNLCPDTLYIKGDKGWLPLSATDTITTTICEEHKICEDDKEKENMNMFKSFEFGPVRGDNVKLSMYGVCVKNKAGTYVAYDTKSGNLMDVDILNFDGQKLLYKVPVALNSVSEGDIVVHNNVPMFVIDVPKDRTSLDVIDPVAGERKEILPAKSPFGFDFVTKVMSLFDQFTGIDKADATNPFGNMLPFMLMSDSKDMKDILPMMMLMGGNVDPMMAMVMMGDGNKDNLLPLMFMMNQKHECKCGGACQH